MDNWEVVVVDNASTDSTLQVARSIASSDSRIKVLANETNLGIAASRNRALEIDMAGVLSRLGFERDGLTIGLTKPMIDRQFLIDHGIHYDASLVVGEDYWFVEDCVAAGAKLVVIPDAMYYYRIHSKQTTKTTNPIDDVISGRRRLEAFLNSDMLSQLPPDSAIRAGADAGGDPDAPPRVTCLAAGAASGAVTLMRRRSS